MKKTLLLLLFLSLCGMGIQTAQAQQGFYTYNEPNRHYITSTVLPTTDGGLLVAVDDGRFPYSSLVENSPAKIIKLSEQMVETGIVQLSDNDVYSFVTDLYPDPNNNNFFYAIGKIHDLECQCEKPYLVHLDNNLNILSQATIDVPEECRYLTDVSTLLAEDSCIYWVSSYQTEFPEIQFSKSSQIYMRINLNGDLEKIKLDDLAGSYCFSGDIFPYGDGSGDFGHLYSVYNYYSGTHNTLIRFTRDLDLTVVYVNDGISLFNEPYGNMIYSISPPCTSQSTLLLPDGKLLYTDQTYEIIWSYDNPSGLSQGCSFMFKINLEQFQIIQYQIIGREDDSSEVVPKKHAIDFITPNELFHCCYAHFGLDNYWFFPKRIMVTKTDDNLNVTWQKSFWFDGQHYCQGVKAAEDGGCWVYGFHRHDGDMRTAFVFRLNADGLLNLPENGQSPHPYAFYPNPIKDKLHLYFSTDFQPERIDLYDLQGRLVHTQQSNFESIDMSQLPAGTYMIRVTLENGKAYSDKVVKE